MDTTTIELSEGARKNLKFIKELYHSLLFSSLFFLVIIGLSIFFAGTIHEPESPSRTKFTIAAFAVPTAVWLITFFFARMQAQKKIKKLHQSNEIDFRLAEQLGSYVQKLLDQVKSGELNKASIADKTTWRPYRVESYPNLKGAGTFSGVSSGFFSSLISGTINMNITPDLLQKSTIVYFVNDATEQKIQVIILSPEAVVAEVQESIRKASSTLINKFEGNFFEGGFGFIGTFGHTSVELRKMAEGLTEISHQLGHTELINELALIVEDKSEQRCCLQLTSIVKGLTLLEAAAIGERSYVIRPAKISSMIDTDIIPLLKA